MYQFFAIVETDGVRELRRIPLEQELQAELSREFRDERKALIPGDAEIIPYEPGYKPDDEVFVLKRYPLPDYLKELAAPDGLPSLQDSELEKGQVKSIFAVQLSNPRPIAMVFQNFNSGQIVRRGGRFKRYLLLEKGTFQNIDRNGLRLDDKATAVIDDGNLYFQSEHLVRRYLDLDSYFTDATDEEIESLLEDPAFVPTGHAVVINQADRWVRRKVTAIRKRAILNKVSVKEIVDVGKEFGVNVATSRDDGQERIVFPQEKKQIKDFLRLLDEDLLRSPLTEARYQVSSKRKITTTGN